MNGNLSITFSIYSNQAGGASLWNEVRTVAVENGLFQVNLGSITPIEASVFCGADRWLGVKVGSDAEMSPRTRIASVGYSMQTGGAAGGDLTGNFPNPTIAAGAVTSAKLAGNSSVNTTGTLLATNSSGFASAVSGTATNTTFTSCGGRFEATGSTGRGVFGVASSATGNYFGGNFISNSSSGVGVNGTANSSSGTVYGVRGYSNSTSGYGVYASNVSGSFAYFGAASFSYIQHHNGNFARLASIADGIEARTNTNLGYGIWAVQGPNAIRAGNFSGNVAISGSLSKGGGSFEIDHPLYPDKKILRHSFVESPDMMNIYNGNVVTDDDGFSWVQLPEYFHALNQDFRYQLTVIGEFAQAIISSEIQNSRFEIRTDKPRVKVSWQVTGIRQDRWAEENRILVEEDKPDRVHGFFIHPELFGMPDNRSMEWGLRPDYMKEREDHSRKVIQENQELLRQIKEETSREARPSSH